MDTETDCSSFSDSLESGYSTISNVLLNPTLSCQSTEEETCLMKIEENFPKSEQSDQDISAFEENFPKSEQSDQDISAFVPYMPIKLRNDLIDVLIIYQHSDKDDAEVLKEEIQSLNYKAKVLDCSVVNSEEFDDLYKRSLLYFLYVTKAFCCCTTALFKSHISLAETLAVKAKKDNIVPVYVFNICNDKSIELDITLRYLNPIKYYKTDKDMKTMKNILEGKKRDILIRDTDLKNRREKYFQEYKDELMALHHADQTRLVDTEPKKNVEDDRSEQTNLKLLASNTMNEDNILSSQCDSATQSTNLTMTFNHNSLTVDGPPSACKNNITQSTGVVSEGRSLQTPSVNPNYSIASSMPLHFSSSCTMSPYGIMYTPTPFGYLPVLPANQPMNTNVHQATTFSNGSVLQGTPSQSTQSSLNSSMQPNLSEPSTSHQMSNASFPPIIYNPYSGLYMHSFPALVTGHGNPSLASQGIWSQQNQPNLQPQETLSQPNRLSQHEGQTSASSSSQEASYHSQSPGQVDGRGDANYYSNSSSGPVQHIHHHHYKEVNIENATNVVIGEKAKVFNTLESSAIAEKSDHLSGPSNVDNENFIIGDSDSPHSVHPNNNTRTDTSRLGQSVPSADCNQELLTSPKEFMGFPECPDPCNIPHTTENSNSQVNENSDETTPKKIV